MTETPAENTPATTATTDGVTDSGSAIAPHSTVTVAGGRSNNLWIAVAGMAVALVLSLVALGLAVHTVSQRNHRISSDTAQMAAEADARTAAINAATKMSTYGYKTFDQDFAWMDTLGTAAWRNQFKGKVDTLVKQLVVPLKENAVGKVTFAAANVQDSTHVIVLTVVEQSLTSDAKPGTNSVTSHLKIVMVKQNGKWLVDDVEPI